MGKWKPKGPTKNRNKVNILISDVGLMSLDWACRDHLWSRGDIIAAAVLAYIHLPASDRDMWYIKSKATDHGEQVCNAISNDDRRKS